jgi:outer membrane usher protein FimD/PapC
MTTMTSGIITDVDTDATSGTTTMMTAIIAIAAIAVDVTRSTGTANHANGFGWKLRLRAAGDSLPGCLHSLDPVIQRASVHIANIAVGIS